MEPIEPYQNQKESQTLEELAQIEGDENAIIMESLERERILGINNKVLLPFISTVSFHHFGRNNFSTFISLRLHAIKVRHSCQEQDSYTLIDIIGKVYYKDGLLLRKMMFLLKRWTELFLLIHLRCKER